MGKPMTAAATSRKELLQAPRLVHELAPLAVVQPAGSELGLNVYSVERGMISFRAMILSRPLYGWHAS